MPSLLPVSPCGNHALCNWLTYPALTPVCDTQYGGGPEPGQHSLTSPPSELPLSTVGGCSPHPHPSPPGFAANLLFTPVPTLTPTTCRPKVSSWFAPNLSAIYSHAPGRRGEVHEPASAATGRRATQRGRGGEDKRKLPTGSNVEARRGVKLTALALDELVVILTGGAGETKSARGDAGESGGGRHGSEVATGGV